MLDNKLVGCMDSLSKNLEQRMYFLKKWLSFNIDSRMLFMFYGAFIESIKTLFVIVGMVMPLRPRWGHWGRW